MKSGKDKTSSRLEFVASVKKPGGGGNSTSTSIVSGTCCGACGLVCSVCPEERTVCQKCQSVHYCSPQCLQWHWTSGGHDEECKRKCRTDSSTRSSASSGNCCGACGLRCSVCPEERTICPKCKEVHYCTPQCLEWHWKSGGHDEECCGKMSQHAANKSVVLLPAIGEDPVAAAGGTSTPENKSNPPTPRKNEVPGRREPDLGHTTTATATATAAAAETTTTTTTQPDLGDTQPFLVVTEPHNSFVGGAATAAPTVAAKSTTTHITPNSPRTPRSPRFPIPNSPRSPRFPSFPRFVGGSRTALQNHHRRDSGLTVESSFGSEVFSRATPNDDWSYRHTDLAISDGFSSSPYNLKSPPPRYNSISSSSSNNNNNQDEQGRNVQGVAGVPEIPGIEAEEDAGVAASGTNSTPESKPHRDSRSSRKKKKTKSKNPAKNKKTKSKTKSSSDRPRKSKKKKVVEEERQLEPDLGDTASPPESSSLWEANSGAEAAETILPYNKDAASPRSRSKGRFKSFTRPRFFSESTTGSSNGSELVSRATVSDSWEYIHLAQQDATSTPSGALELPGIDEDCSSSEGKRTPPPPPDTIPNVPKTKSSLERNERNIGERPVASEKTQCLERIEPNVGNSSRWPTALHKAKCLEWICREKVEPNMIKPIMIGDGSPWLTDDTCDQSVGLNPVDVGCVPELAGIDKVPSSSSERNLTQPATITNVSPKTKSLEQKQQQPEWGESPWRAPPPVDAEAETVVQERRPRLVGAFRTFTIPQNLSDLTIGSTFLSKVFSRPSKNDEQDLDESMHPEPSYLGPKIGTLAEDQAGVGKESKPIQTTKDQTRSSKESTRAKDSSPTVTNEGKSRRHKNETGTPACPVTSTQSRLGGNTRPVVAKVGNDDREVPSSKRDKQSFDADEPFLDEYRTAAKARPPPRSAGKQKKARPVGPVAVAMGGGDGNREAKETRADVEEQLLEDYRTGKSRPGKKSRARPVAAVVVKGGGNDGREAYYEAYDQKQFDVEEPFLDEHGIGKPDPGEKPPPISHATIRYGGHSDISLLTNCIMSETSPKAKVPRTKHASVIEATSKNEQTLYEQAYRRRLYFWTILMSTILCILLAVGIGWFFMFWLSGDLEEATDSSSSSDTESGEKAVGFSSLKLRPS